MPRQLMPPYDCYKILGIARDATPEDVKQAYRRLARSCHPDRFTDAAEKETAEEKFKQINAAYEYLKANPPKGRSQPPNSYKSSADYGRDGGSTRRDRPPRSGNDPWRYSRDQTQSNQTQSNQTTKPDGQKGESATGERIPFNQRYPNTYGHRRSAYGDRPGFKRPNADASSSKGPAADSKSNSSQEPSSPPSSSSQNGSGQNGSDQNGSGQNGSSQKSYDSKTQRSEHERSEARRRDAERYRTKRPEPKRPEPKRPEPKWSEPKWSAPKRSKPFYHPPSESSYGPYAGARSPGPPRTYVPPRNTSAWECKDTWTSLESGVTAIALTRDNRTLLTACTDHTLLRWSLTTGRVLDTIRSRYGPFLTLSIDASQRRFATGSREGMVEIWSLPKIQLLDSLNGHERPVRGVAFGGAETLVSGSSDGTIRLWDLKKGRSDKTWSPGSSGIGSLALSRDGKTLVTGILDEPLRLWHGQTGKALIEFEDSTLGDPLLQISPDSAFLAAGGTDGSIKLWSFRDGSFSRRLLGLKGPVKAIAFCPNRTMIAAGGDDPDIRLWDYNTGELLGVLPGHTSTITGLVFNSNGSQLISASDDRSIRFWKAP